MNSCGFNNSDTHHVSRYDQCGDGLYTGSLCSRTLLPHGNGCMEYNAGSEILRYDGSWKMGQWDGYGSLMFSNGDSYIGMFHHHTRHGNGTYIWNDGRTYEGEFVQNMRHGKGTFQWPEDQGGASYYGEFHHGLRHGQGSYHFLDGNSYQGSWARGEYNGYGVFSWKNGRQYQGEWLNSKRHGRGVELDSRGNIEYEGLWENHRPALSLNTATLPAAKSAPSYAAVPASQQFGLGMELIEAEDTCDASSFCDAIMSCCEGEKPLHQEVAQPQISSLVRASLGEYPVFPEVAAAIDRQRHALERYNARQEDFGKENQCGQQQPCPATPSSGTRTLNKVLPTETQPQMKTRLRNAAERQQRAMEKAREAAHQPEGREEHQSLLNRKPAPLTSRAVSAPRRYRRYESGTVTRQPMTCRASSAPSRPTFREERSRLEARIEHLHL